MGMDRAASTDGGCVHAGANTYIHTSQLSTYTNSTTHAPQNLDLGDVLEGAGDEAGQRQNVEEAGVVRHVHHRLVHRREVLEAHHLVEFVGLLGLWGGGVGMGLVWFFGGVLLLERNVGLEMGLGCVCG